MSVVKFLRESKEEMTDRVTWTKFSELQSTSWLVLVASLIFAVVVGAMDWVFRVGVETFYNLFK